VAVAGLNPVRAAVVSPEPAAPDRLLRAVGGSSLAVVTADQPEASAGQRREGLGVVVTAHAWRLPGPQRRETLTRQAFGTLDSKEAIVICCTVFAVLLLVSHNCDSASWE
jgi:hypothetical protein